MSVQTEGSPARGRVSRWFVGDRWWAGLTLAYLLTRVTAVVAFLVAARDPLSRPRSWRGDEPVDAWRLMHQAWDANWYTIIVEDGYPETLPRGEDGRVWQNPYAFYPLYPMTVRLLSALGHVSTGAAAIALNTVLGLVAVLLMRRLLLAYAPQLASTRPWFLFTAPVAMAAFPAAGVFSANYSEATAMVVLLATLLALQKQRWGWLVVGIVALGLVRPLAVPLGLVILVHFAPKFLAHWRGDGADDPGRRIWTPDLARFVALGMLSVASVLLWPVLVGLLSGEADGLFLTQDAWKRPGGTETTAPFAVLTAQAGSGWLAALWVTGWIGLCLGGALLPANRALGPQLHAWSLGYLVFILATVGVGGSGTRYTLFALTFHTSLAAPVRRGWQAALVVAGLLWFQFDWISTRWSGEGHAP
ncbi:hypothetical protein [Nocardioides yefusunii]|uniref:Integral membrane protein n=1 Tax=Nocardioides yefusunii TaxID=2500546 RepID=A0ABW1QVG5_9ACTN|nr:hypothetical protein [Nocardioides yefusunii]